MERTTDIAHLSCVFKFEMVYGPMCFKSRRQELLLRNDERERNLSFAKSTFSGKL